MKNCLVWLFFPLLFVVACNTEPYPEEIKLLDSLIVKLDSSKSKVLKLDTTKLDKTVRSFAKRFKTILHFYHEKGDTIGPDLAYLLADLATLKKMSLAFEPEYTAVKDALDFSRQQMVNLRHDLEYNLLEASRVMQLMQTEKENAAYAMSHAENLINLKDSIDAKFLIYIPAMDSLSHLIKEKQ